MPNVHSTSITVSITVNPGHAHCVQHLASRLVQVHTTTGDVSYCVQNHSGLFCMFLYLPFALVSCSLPFLIYWTSIVAVWASRRHTHTHTISAAPFPFARSILVYNISGFSQEDNFQIADQSFPLRSHARRLKTPLRPSRILSHAVGATRAYHGLYCLVWPCLTYRAEPLLLPYAHALAGGCAINTVYIITPEGSKRTEGKYNVHGPAL